MDRRRGGAASEVDDQSQSVNLWIKTPDLKTLSHMYRHAWHAGLKTTYYLRSLGASNIEKATVSVKKEMRGAVIGDAAGAPGIVEKALTPLAMAAEDAIPPVVGKGEFSDGERQACSVEAIRSGGSCEACQ
jgi:ribonucleoside-diphosphate reductase alpha chain